jgi:hypothetical protein
MSSSSQQELENRLRMLTESLIEKQTMLESLSTEKNSLGLQLERMEVSKVFLLSLLLLFPCRNNIVRQRPVLSGHHQLQST